MNERIRMLLLQALEQEGDIGNLEKAGYQYAEIAEEYSRLINEGLILLDSYSGVRISKKGYQIMEEIKERLNRNGTWKIEPYVKYKTKKLGRFDIFIE